MLKEKFSILIKESLLEKNEIKTRTFRSVLAKITEEEKKTGQTISDGEILKVVEKVAKQRLESMEAFEKAGRNDLFEIEKEEYLILKEYIPSKLNKVETEELLRTIIAEGFTNIGSIMKELQRYGNVVDKKLASEILKTIL